MTVWLKGQCKNCKKHHQEKIYDYGVLTFEELEHQLDNTKHYIKPLECPKCRNQYSPEKILYMEEKSGLLIDEMYISYGNSKSAEETEAMEKAHRERYLIYEKEKEHFWDRYTDYALVNWRQMVNELVDFEIKYAFEKMKISSNSKTIGQYRKEVLNRIKTIEEKQSFWRLANQYFIEQHLLDIGPMGWAIEKDVKYYGHKRMRFIILYFPLGEGFEKERTEWIGRIIKKEKGDNDFLFRRIRMVNGRIATRPSKSDEVLSSD